MQDDAFEWFEWDGIQGYAENWKEKKIFTSWFYINSFFTKNILYFWMANLTLKNNVFGRSNVQLSLGGNLWNQEKKTISDFLKVLFWFEIDWYDPTVQIVQYIF